MNEESAIPEFAIIGHPNEGKSSLVSTLSEDDSVRISPYPGETVECRVFPVSIDGVDVIRFTDTPGFQAPRQTLSWFENHPGLGHERLASFIRENKGNDLFKDECELLSPLARNAGIIYVVDGARPIRNTDRAEMKILALTDLPRIAVINTKSDNAEYVKQWESAFQDYFDTVCHFNAHKASYLERINLLEQLKTIQRDNPQILENVIAAFKQEWSRRNAIAAELIISLAEHGLTHQIKAKVRNKSRTDDEKKRLQALWACDIKTMEKKAHENIRLLFKHNIFNILMPDQPLLSNDLFDSETWRVLGLSKNELATSAASLGAAAGAVFDLALAGHSLGLFAVLGGIAGGASALLGADKIGRATILGKHLGSYRIKVGPSKNIQLMYILVDRALIFYSHVINWAHGNRHGKATTITGGSGKHIAYASTWNKTIKGDLLNFFSHVHAKKTDKKEPSKKHAVDSLKKYLDSLPYRMT